MYLYSMYFIYIHKCIFCNMWPVSKFWLWAMYVLIIYVYIMYVLIIYVHKMYVLIIYVYIMYVLIIYVYMCLKNKYYFMRDIVSSWSDRPALANTHELSMGFIKIFFKRINRSTLCSVTIQGRLYQLFILFANHSSTWNLLTEPFIIIFLCS